MNRLILLALGATIGVLMGLFLPLGSGKPSLSYAHLTSHALRWQPAAGVSTSTNECGWHDNCLNLGQNPWSGLDFTAGSDFKAYLNVYGYADSNYQWPIAKVTFSTPNFGSCKAIKAHVRSYWTDAELHNQWFVHTNSLQLTLMYLYGWHEAYRSNQRHVGNMVTSDNCPWGGVHVHMDNTGPWTEYHNPLHAESSTAYPWAPAAFGAVGNWNLDRWAYRVGWWPY